MADEKIDLDLDPKKVIDSLNLISGETKKLAENIESSLGKDAVKSVQKMEMEAEKGTTKISTYFRNLGTRIKEDLKTAFDIGRLMSGLKVSEQLAHGAAQVLDMEKAFDKLNTRIGLSGKALNEFKNAVGRNAAAAGQKVEDILPGVEVAASKGGIKNAGELAAVSQTLSQARGITGEDTGALADSLIEILRSEGKKVTAESMKETMDAIQGTRTAGAFGSAGEAASAVEAVLKGLGKEQQKSMGIGTREAGGLAAMASKAGSGGQDILNTILNRASTPKGQELINAIFGTQIFNKQGKFDAGAFSKVNKQGFGQYTAFTRANELGTNQADLDRFIDAMKGNISDLGQVSKGANETADQFGVATDNLATKIDKFKEGAKESGRELGESVSNLANVVLSGKGDLPGAMKGVGKAISENKGSLAAIAGTAAIGAIAVGGGANSILRKIPGVGGILGSVAGGEIAKAAGVTPVYVTNASEIGGGVVGKGLGDLLAGAGGKLGKFGALAGTVGTYGAGGLAAGAAGYGVGTLINSGLDKVIGNKGLGGELYDLLHPEEGTAQASMQINPSEIKEAVKAGMIDGHRATKTPPTYTNPSTVTPRGVSQ